MAPNLSLSSATLLVRTLRTSCLVLLNFGVRPRCCTFPPGLGIPPSPSPVNHPFHHRLLWSSTSKFFIYPSSYPTRLTTALVAQVGNKDFANYVDDHVHLTHINNEEDPIPTVPMTFLGYVHPSGEVHITDSGPWESCPGVCSSHSSQWPTTRTRILIYFFAKLLQARTIRQRFVSWVTCRPSSRAILTTILGHMMALLWNAEPR